MPIWRLMTNSSRARPTPAVRQPGEREGLVRGADVHHDLDADLGHRAELGALDVEVEQPLVDEAGVALGAGDGDLASVGEVPGRRAVPTTAGMPSSRAMIAAWQVRPPRLVTIAEARFMIGSQSGSVMSATRTSPASKSCICSTDASTFTAPAPIFWPIARPSTSTSAPP